MPLSPGTYVGTFEILAQLGTGGMGEVYRARDSRLGREVAIKVLPEAFAQNAERMSRFEREAHLLASIHHPNIATLFGLEESGPIRGLVMELVEGQTLEERLAAGRIPFDEVIAVTRQIATALEAAHERGIIHRDLKPANIKITPNGTVKVLDFGLAKAFETEPKPQVPSANSPTLTMGATLSGLLLGTAAYMSPEQAKGRAVDRRADIWSFGVVVAEMLSGKQMYRAETPSESLAAVLLKDPDLSTLPADTPLSMIRLLERCLEKDPLKRLRDIGEARIVLEAPLALPASRERPAAGKRLILAWAVASAFAVSTLLLAGLHFGRSLPPQKVVQFTISVDDHAQVESLAVSPDGQFLALTLYSDGRRQIALRALDGLSLQPLAATDGGGFPFWSPDSRYLGFFADGRMKKIALAGGGVQTLCDAPEARSASWSKDGIILFSTPGGELQRVSQAGGVPVAVTQPAERERHTQPQFLSDGRRYLYYGSRGPNAPENGLYLGSLDGSATRRIAEGIITSNARFVAAGDGSSAAHLLYLAGRTLMAMPFEERQARMAGEVFPVAEQVAAVRGFGSSAVTASASGVLVYRRESANQLAWFDRHGKPLGLGPKQTHSGFALSPDAKRLAVLRTSWSGATMNSDIWVHDLTSQTESRLTTDGAYRIGPVWSPDGNKLAFASTRKGPYQLFVKDLNSSAVEEVLFAETRPKVPLQWLRDGSYLIFQSLAPKGLFHIWSLSQPGGANENRKAAAVAESAFSERCAQVSPDGRWMAFASDETGLPEVYVRPFPSGPGKWKVSLAGGSQPRWRSDGRELYFLDSGKMMSAAVKTGAVFEASTPVPRFDVRVGTEFGLMDSIHHYDVTPDGSRFLINGPGEGADAPLTVVVNWQRAVSR